MGKRRADSRREERHEASPSQEKRSKRRHEVGSTSQPMVNPNLSRLLRDSSRMEVYNRKFLNREVMEYKHVNFPNLVKLFDNQNVDVANYIAIHNWNEFVEVHRPINRILIRVLISNLDESTMISSIGKIKVDLSEKNWCNVFDLEMISKEEEAAVMELSKEEIFFRLTGLHNLGIAPYIRINQLHQEANVRLAAQVVMNVLVPKKGSKEQLKIEEGRLLYAMIYGKKINLARLIIERLKAAWGRKSSPICYGMHLMELMAKAGVDLYCAGIEETQFNSVIDHHTLRRLGYKNQHGGWDYVGTGHKKAKAPVVDEEEEEEDEEGSEQAERRAAPPTQSQAPSTSRPQSEPHPIPSQPTSLPTNLATKDDLVHLQQFLFEQFQLSQARILSKLDLMDSRIKNLEDHLILQPQPSPYLYSPIQDPTNPKGKGPTLSPALSIHSSSHTSPHSSYHTSHHSLHQSPKTSPKPTQSHPSTKTSSSSSSTSHAATTRFKLAARKTTTTASTVHISPTSSNSEATHSDPNLHTSSAAATATPLKSTSPTKPPSPQPPPKPASPIPTPQPSSPPSNPIPAPTTAHPIPLTYRRRKLPVTRPKPIGHPYLLMPPPSTSPSPSS